MITGFENVAMELKRQLRRHAVLGPRLLAALATCIMLTACGGSTGQPQQAAGGQPQQAAGGRPQQAAGGQGGPWADTVTGTVVWPDGSPLANGQIDIFPQGEAGDGTMDHRAGRQLHVASLCAVPMQ